jgi:hypothetical protein
LATSTPPQQATTTTTTTTTTSLLIPGSTTANGPSLPPPYLSGVSGSASARPSSTSTVGRPLPHPSSPLALLAAVRTSLPEVLHGLGYEDARWRVLPQGDEVCMLHVWPPAALHPLPSPPSVPGAEATIQQAAQIPGRTAPEDGEEIQTEQQPAAITPGTASSGQGSGALEAESSPIPPQRPSAPVRIAITLVAPWHFCLQLPDSAAGVGTHHDMPRTSSGQALEPQLQLQVPFLAGTAAAPAQHGALRLNASAALRDRLLTKQGWVVAPLDVSNWVGLRRNEQVMAVRKLIHNTLGAASLSGIPPIPFRKRAGVGREPRNAAKKGSDRKRHA